MDSSRERCSVQRSRHLKRNKTKKADANSRGKRVAHLSHGHATHHHAEEHVGHIADSADLHVNGKRSCVRVCACVCACVCVWAGVGVRACARASKQSTRERTHARLSRTEGTPYTCQPMCGARKCRGWANRVLCVSE